METLGDAGRTKRIWGLCVLASLVVGLIATYVATRRLDYTLFDLQNLIGPTAKSLTEGHGLEGSLSVGSLGDPITFRSGRMPMAPVVVALLSGTLGAAHILLASLIKATLFMAPLWAAMRLVLRRVAPGAQGRAAALLLAPFAITAFLADVANLQVEEGYAFSILAYALALVLFPDPGAEAARPYRRATLLGLSLAGLFLTKSSLVLVAAVLGVAYLVQQRSRGPRLVAACLLLSAMLGWGLFQKSASGHFALGTSLDGINFHKGNHERFAELYPPRPGENLDGYDAVLAHGHLYVDEWDYDASNKAEAVAYMRENPGQTLRNDASKAFQYFVSVSKSGSMESTGAMRFVETVGYVLFRLGLLAATVLSLRAIGTDRSPGRFAGWIFLGVSFFGALPYLLGFAYTRHASVLIYPVVLLLCRALPQRTEAALAGGDLPRPEGA